MLRASKLLISFRDFLTILAIFTTIFSIQLFSIYSDYRELIKKEFYFTNADILNIYQKSSYYVISLYSKELDLKFLTTSYRKDLNIGSLVRVKLYPDINSTLIDYLTTPYIKSKIISIKDIDLTLKQKLLSEISMQHRDNLVTQFYQAIFLANPISKELREIVSALGISHLIALSGFHLGILFGFLFYIINPPYTKLQQKFFPYRYNLLDIGIVSIVVLGVFLYLTSSPPSLIRAYIMFIIGWAGVILGLEVKSFSLLFVVTLVSLAIFPKLIFSISFWFSILGVFYIFLILKSISIKNSYITAIVTSILIFILMLPIVHAIFPLTSKLQLISPLLSMVFSIFYPVSIVLHFLNIGDIFDSLLIWIFSLEADNRDIYLSPIFTILYIIISIGAVFYRKIFYILLSISFLWSFYIYVINL